MASLANLSYPVVRRRFGTAVRAVRTHGWVTGGKYVAQMVFEDWWALGKAVELLGDRGQIEGARFELGDPHIDTRLKSRFLLGSWEVETRHLIRRHLPPDIPVIDLGGSIGVVACVTNRLMDFPERHVVVEPSPRAANLLESHRSLNNCRYEIVSAALGYGTDEILFDLDHRINEGRVIRSAAPTSTAVISVPTVTLAVLLESHGFSRAAVIADIEGAEYDLIEHEGQVLSEFVEWFFVELHGPKDDQKELRKKLEHLGFRLVEDLNDRNAAYRNSALLDR